MAGSCYMLAHILNIAVGLTFSGGIIDLFLFGILKEKNKLAADYSMVLFIFCCIILSFHFLLSVLIFKTPGREDDDTETKLYTKVIIMPVSR